MKISYFFVKSFVILLKEFRDFLVESVVKVYNLLLKMRE